MTHPNSRYRVCTKCLKRKPFSAFPEQMGRVQSQCFDCRNAYYRAYNTKRYSSPEARAAELKRNREKYHRVIKHERAARKRRLILIMGGKCCECGYAKSAAALDFHHLDRTGKSRTVSHLLAVSQPWGFEAAIKEAKKCRLVCANCHREATFPG